MEQRYETLIDSLSLAARVDDPQWRIFDCRFDLAAVDKGEQAYGEGHIPGSLYAHLDRHLSGPLTADTGRHPLPDPQGLVRWLSGCGVAHDTQVVAYDDSGGTMAVRLWWLLRWLGHRAVAVLDGGWQGWRDAGLPLSRATSSPLAAHFSGVPDWSQVVTTDELLRPEPSRLLIDVRTAERFRGDREPIDPVAGHIPGAVNLPLQRNLGPDGRFLPIDALRDLYAPRMAGRAPAHIALMCGSGVTACHSILALAVAGYPGARLYAGSWSEWIRDPDRPVALGAD